jgi:hypothetical protein
VSADARQPLLAGIFVCDITRTGPAAIDGVRGAIVLERTTCEYFVVYGANL